MNKYVKTIGMTSGVALFTLILSNQAAMSAGCIEGSCTGYTKTAAQCQGKDAIRCPFDTSKYFCHEISCPDGSLKDCPSGQVIASTATIEGTICKYCQDAGFCPFGTQGQNCTECGLHLREECLNKCSLKSGAAKTSCETFCNTSCKAACICTIEEKRNGLACLTTDSSSYKFCTKYTSLRCKQSTLTTYSYTGAGTGQLGNGFTSVNHNGSITENGITYGTTSQNGPQYNCATCHPMSGNINNFLEGCI